VGGDRTRSDLERDFLQLCRHYRLPTPEVNVRVGRWTVDFLWRRQRLAVETDSLRYHGGSVAFEDDHARDLDLRARGFDVRRFTERQVLDASAQVAADLRDALAPAS
jgi:very-short-patch-repair endonuclease